MRPISPEFTRYLDAVMRGELDRWSAVWFWILIASTVAVVLGLIAELPEVWAEVIRPAWRWAKNLSSTKTRKYDFNGWERVCPELAVLGTTELSARAKAVIGVSALLGWMLVAVGVAGEGVAEYFVNDAETEVRAFDSAELAETQNSANSAAAASSLAFAFSDKSETASSNALVGAKDALTKAGAAQQSLGKAESDAQLAAQESKDAIDRAGKAEASLGRAEAEAKSAETSASNALTLARDARKEAASFEHELDRIRLPRALVRQAEFNLKMSQFIGTEYTFASVFQDEESITFLRILDAALQDAGWRRVKPPGGFPAINVFGATEGFSVPVGFGTGVAVIVESNESLPSLRNMPEIKLPASVRTAVTLTKALSWSISPREEIELIPSVSVVTGNSATVRIAVGKKK
jgi:hypothetical protein